MDESKDIILTMINEYKSELKSFKQNIGDDREKFSRIKAALKELQSLDKILKELQQLCATEEKTLNEISLRLNDIQRDELLDKTDDMFKAILMNLPKEMDLKKREIEKDKSPFFKSLSKDRMILNNGFQVGEIKVLEHTDLGLRIKVKINENEDVFYIDQPLRVYSIISFILTKFNYE